MFRRKVRDWNYAFLLLVLLLFVMLASYAYAQEAVPPDNGTFQRGTSSRAPGVTVAKPLSSQAERSAESQSPGSHIKLERAAYSLGHPELFHTMALSEREAECGTEVQLLLNTKMDVVELPDFGTAEPWVNLVDFIYWDKDNYTSPDYSLYMVDVDPDLFDPTPDQDALAQGFFMPDDLTKVTIEYNVLTYESNIYDALYGDLWSLDQGGYLDEFLYGWTISDSESVWGGRFVEISDKDDLASMSGKTMAIVFLSETDDYLPGEWGFFDDITLTACYKKPTVPQSKMIYLPSIQKPGVPVPLCAPPTENPQDQYNANRGFTQTNAACKSTLSNLDRADYYTFRPDTSGSHTLQLKKLPKDTEWSAMIFTDSPSPQYAPGETGGQCRIDTPGSKDKQVKCDLSKGKDYFIKVSAGSTPKAGGYEMKVVK